MATWAATYDRVTDAVVVSDQEGNIMYANPAVKTIFGQEDAVKIERFHMNISVHRLTLSLTFTLTITLTITLTFTHTHSLSSLTLTLLFFFLPFVQLTFR